MNKMRISRVKEGLKNLLFVAIGVALILIFIDFVFAPTTIVYDRIQVGDARVRQVVVLEGEPPVPTIRYQLEIRHRIANADGDVVNVIRSWILNTSQTSQVMSALDPAIEVLKTQYDITIVENWEDPE